mmetsp:Transcript_8952/g.11622  ORF Transcript_8952/g.11622 Transcript_8952/m.11622 type:complete len:237 (-) Transcript_8952:87-797(-)|eukprot:CAMPEP_0117842492 /NCGR_PEP_ID=MMETSP0949-20121206/16081_1 /TAXON_ID=44440 /ORGANISM="Chattonella subsalsa, Strain CCMP2191" /LENGTH=236 /DNA_ID=CAMNT_0005686619 /DNA_START=94 /DNA_END=807 /DNA_ORIENTATION=+
MGAETSRCRLCGETDDILEDEDMMGDDEDQVNFKDVLGKNLDSDDYSTMQLKRVSSPPKVVGRHRPRIGSNNESGPLVITSRGVNERVPDNDVDSLQAFKKIMSHEGFPIQKGAYGIDSEQSRWSFLKRHKRIIKIDLDQRILTWNTHDHKKKNSHLNRIPLSSISEISQGPFPASRLTEIEGRCQVQIKSRDPDIEICFASQTVEAADFFIDGLALLCAEKVGESDEKNEMKFSI